VRRRNTGGILRIAPYQVYTPYIHCVRGKIEPQTILDRNKSKVKVKKGISSSRTLPHRYRKSHTIWDHTVLPAIRQRWLSCLYPSRSWYSIERPRRDARLSWPRWWLHPQDSQKNISGKITGSAVTGIRTHDILTTLLCADVPLRNFSLTVPNHYTTKTPEMSNLNAS